MSIFYLPAPPPSCARVADRVAVASGLFLRVNTSHELSVDMSRGEKLNINVRSSAALPLAPLGVFICFCQCRSRFAPHALCPGCCSWT